MKFADYQDVTTMWAPDFSVVEPFAVSGPLYHSRVRPALKIDWMMLSLVALCAFSAVLGRLCYLLRPFDSDGSMFIYMGRLVSEGGRFCHDLVDNKFPTVGLLTSASLSGETTAYPAIGTAISLKEIVESFARVRPVVESGWDTVFAEVKQAGIPLIVLDRHANVPDNLFSAFIGSLP